MKANIKRLILIIAVILMTIVIQMIAVLPAPGMHTNPVQAWPYQKMQTDLPGVDRPGADDADWFILGRMNQSQIVRRLDAAVAGRCAVPRAGQAHSTGPLASSGQARPRRRGNRHRVESRGWLYLVDESGACSKLWR